MPVLTGEFVISQRCVGTIAEDLSLTLPATVAAEPLYYEDGEFRQFRDAAYRELGQMGLFDRREPSPAFIDSLTVLCTADVEFYGFVATTDRQYTLHVAARGQDAVFAALAGEEVLLRPGHPQSLVSELLAELPEARPAGGRTMSAPEADIQPMSERSQATGAAPRGDARRLIELLTQPHQAAGKLHTATRIGVDARRVYSTDPIGFVDTEQGRWLTYATGADGARHVTAAPGRTEAITNKLHEAQQELQR